MSKTGAFVMVFWRKDRFGTCAYCGVHCKTTKDHVMPKTRLPSLKHNMVPACAACNTDKGCRGVGEWLLDMFRQSKPCTKQYAHATRMFQRVHAWLRRDAFCEAVCDEWARHVPRLRACVISEH